MHDGRVSMNLPLEPTDLGSTDGANDSTLMVG